VASAEDVIADGNRKNRNSWIVGRKHRQSRAAPLDPTAAAAAASEDRKLVFRWTVLCMKEASTKEASHQPSSDGPAAAVVT